MVEKAQVDLSSEINEFLGGFEQKPLSKILENVPDQYREEFRTGVLEIGEGIRIVGEEEERTVIIPLSSTDYEYSFLNARVKDYILLEAKKRVNDDVLDKINAKKQRFQEIAGEQKIRRVIVDKERELRLEEIRAIPNKEKMEQTGRDIDRFTSLVSFAEELIDNGNFVIDIEKPQKVK